MSTTDLRGLPPHPVEPAHSAGVDGDPQAARALVRAALETTRARTLALLEPLDDRAVHGQFHDFLSPVVWDVGHVGNFEELWLVRTLGGRPAHDERLDTLYNAFENPRWTRGDLPILDRDEALPYLADVRGEALMLLDRADLRSTDDPRMADGYVHRMIVQHESQHQETILQSLDLRDGPAAYELGGVTSGVAARHVDDTERVEIPAGPFVLGTDDRRWTYDNERPSHTVDLPTYFIDRHPVSNRRFAAFVTDGGYDDRRWWSDRGWAWRDETGHEAPQGWVRDRDAWRLRRFGRVVPLDPREPVQHVSFFEAEAFATWAGGRLPTEQEWEKAAAWDPAAGRSRRYPWGDAPPTPALANVGLSAMGPHPVGSHPAGASAYGVEQLAGDVYEWTTSGFEPYPGFVAFPYREYSEVFFGDDYRVLRGSSWAIHPAMARATYRNWDHPYRRQIMAGLRLVWDRGDAGPDGAPAGERR